MVEFSWWNVVPTLVGGCISIVATIAMFSLAQIVDRRKRSHEKKKEDAAHAFTGFWKLKAVAETLDNLKREILRAFASAEQRGLLGAEPSQIVQGFVGAQINLEFLTAKEVLFLNKEKRSDLMAEADLIIRRAKNVEKSVEKYSDLRESFQLFLEGHADEMGPPAALIGQFSLSGKNAAIAKLKIQTMNDLLHQIQNFIQNDAVAAKELTDAYLDVARKHFGVEFPDFKFEWVDQ